MIHIEVILPCELFWSDLLNIYTCVFGVQSRVIYDMYKYFIILLPTDAEA